MRCPIFLTGGRAAVLASLVASAYGHAAFGQTAPESPPAPAATAPAPAAAPDENPISKPTPAVAEPTAPPAVATPPFAATPTDAAPTDGVVAEAKTEKKKWPWRGSVSFRSMTSLTALDKSYEQSYLPSEALGVLMTPRYQLNDTMSIGLWQYSTVELTNTANTTYYREPQLSDTIVMFGWAALNTVKAKNDDGTDNTAPHGVALSVTGVLGLPTSKASIAKQLYMAPGLGVGARYVWHGLTVGLNTRVQHSFYKSTGAVYQQQPITTCTGDAVGCDPSLLSTGVRSPEWRVLAIGSLAYTINDKFSVSISGGEIMDWLPSLTPASIHAIGAGGAPVPTGDDQNFRALMYTGAGVDYTIVPWLSAGAGIEGYYSQLTLNSTYEMPWVNRYMTGYLELTVALDGLPH